MDLNKLYEVCYDLAALFYSQEDNLKIEDTEGHISDISNAADNYYGIALDYSFSFQNLGENTEIIIRAIKYIQYVHAMPIHKDNYQWFDHVLSTLIELACPKIIIDGEARDFLNDIVDGINISRSQSD